MAVLLTPPKRRRLVVAAWGRCCPILLLMAGMPAGGCHRSVVPPTASIRRPPAYPEVVPPPVLSVPEPLTPDPVSPDSPVDPITKDDPWKPETSPRDWKYIVLHHTASDQGDVQSIHESHLKNKDRSGRPWLGIGYHFVVGNGRGMQDGEIEGTFRWKQQLQGAHAGVAEYNQQGIGIVLVGNFEETAPTAQQVRAVKRLVRRLSRDYEIGSDHIIGHADVKATQCPGTHFPLAEIRDCVTAADEGDSLATRVVR